MINVAICHLASCRCSVTGLSIIKALFTAITKTRGWRMPGMDEGVKIKGKI